MARCFLPCESEAWPEDRRLFTLLSQLQTLEEFNRLLDTHIKEEAKEGVCLATRLLSLKGLGVFLAEACSEEEREVFFRRTLPFVARSASCLDMLVPEGGIPFVQQQEAATVSLSRRLILSLLANALLCTIPKEHPLGAYQQRFGFDQFFQVFTSEDPVLRSSQAAKLKCVLNYFNRMLEREGEDRAGVVYFTRQVMDHSQLPSLNSWLSSQYPLCPVTLEDSQAIEEAGSRTLQVVFASSCIGGEVIGGGADQEEIRFCICPEMLTTLLIMDELAANESVIVTGAERFSSCFKQQEALQYGGDYQDQYERDVYGNLNTASVAIPFRDHHSTPEQIYSQSSVLHELNQALIGYSCWEDQGDLHAHLVSINQWSEDDPALEMDLTTLDTSSQATFEEETEEEEEGVVEFDKGLEEFAATLSVNAVKEALKKVKEQEEEVKEVGEKGREPHKAAVEVVASTLTDTILSEVKKPPISPSPPSRIIPSNTKTREAIDSYAANLSQQILAEMKQELLQGQTIPVAISISGPVHTSASASNTPQGEEVESGSRRGSRSSSYTGQPLLLDEFTDNLVEEAVKSGLAEAVQEGGGTGESGGPPVVLKVPQVSKPAGEEETAALASSLVAAAFEKAKKSLVTTPKKTVLSMSSAGKDLTSPTKQRKTPKKSPGKKTSSKKHYESMQVDGPAEGGLFLQIPLSRMSVAWSTASTRDDESAPASPTELDHIALGMVTNVEEYSTLLADIIIRDVITMYSTPQQLVLAQCAPEEEERKGGFSYRVQTFLHSLEEVKSFSAEPDITGIPPFSPHCYNLRKSILRPVASGLREKGSSDPQLEAVLQWLAVSMCGRPEMRYHTFKEDKLQPFSEVSEQFLRRGMTVGELTQLVVDYCEHKLKGETDEQLFTVLLQS